MRGHQQLIAMRKDGFVPDCVWIDTDHDHLNCWRDWHGMDSRHAHVQIEPAERRFDLRCVIGLPCFVQGSDRRRVFAVRDACIAAGAARVIASVTQQRGQGDYATFEAIESSDTEGVFAWSPKHHG